MNFLSKWEKKYGRYAIRNLPMYIISFYVVGYVLWTLKPEYLNYLTLEPYYILRGQVWRIISWVLIPPEQLDIFTIIMLYFYFSLGRTLEQTWGAFRFNVYIFSGILFTALGSFVLYFILGGNGLFGGLFSTYYINLSIFLAFAATYPDVQVLFMMFIPLKVKWLGLIFGAVIVYDFLMQSMVGKFVIAVSLLNFIVFYLSTCNFKQISPKEIHRKQQFKRSAAGAQEKPKTGYRHKCAVCGRTENDGDHLEFRFCSKCDGDYEYCQDHLFTHEHVKKG